MSITACFGCTKQPSSGLAFQEGKKGIIIQL
jgi:hypothetical protein